MREDDIATDMAENDMEAINEKLGTVNCKDVISKYNMADPDQRKAKLAECKGIIEMCAAQSIREICKEI